MCEARGETAPMAWSEPVKATPIVDILALRLRELAARSGVPVDSPEAWPSLADRLDPDRKRTGIIVRRTPEGG